MNVNNGYALMFNAKQEKQRQERDTPEHILELAKRNGEFSVSLRYRDDWLRRRCAKLRNEGKLVGGHRSGRVVIFYPAKQ